MSQSPPVPASVPTLPELWVLRHGETEWNRAGRMQGHLDSPLTPKGRAQARQQGEILQRLTLPRDTVLVTSPSGRAQRTAEIVNEKLALPVKTAPAFTEINMGDWQGETVEQLLLSNPAVAVQDDPHLWKFNAPGGETLAEMNDRVLAGLSRLQGPAVLVTHGVTSRLLRCYALGLAPEALATLPGGQGIVHHIKEGHASVLK